jgi:hypothetical protein
MRGEAAGAAGPDTLRAAELRALTEGLRTLGVTVESELIDVQTQTGGEARVSIRSKGVERLQAVEVRKMRSASCYDAALGVARATVAIPDAEWARIGREQRGGVLVVVDCVSEPAGACGEATREAVRSTASNAGLDIRSTIIPPEDASPNHTHAVQKMGIEHGVARVLWVRLRPTFGMSQNEVMYAWTEVSATFSETGDGGALHTVSPEKVKGALPQMARYTELDAMRESLKGATESLAEKLRSLPSR